jgi:hypothetical protein
MQPATELPWKQGDAPTYVAAATGGEFVAACWKAEDAAYIVHVCNLFDKMVATMSTLIDQAEEGSGGCNDEARELLDEADLWNLR